EIENIITTNDELYRAFSSSSTRIDAHTKEVLNYREALWAGFNKLKFSGLLTTNAFIEIVQKLKQNSSGIRTMSGTVIKNAVTDEIIYTPPVGESIIRSLLGKLEKFINNDDDGFDPLIKLALIHYQFEAIHPFYDGNGRTGRIISILYLVQQKLIELPILYLSEYIIENKDQYYRLLQQISRDGKWENWIMYILDALELTSSSTRSKIFDINQLLHETLDFAKNKLPSRVYSKELIETLFEQPYCKVRILVDRGIAKRQTAAEYLKECEKSGILSSEKLGKEILYLNTNLLRILSE
ncbi:Fic family protein, partial [Bacteroidota bacterium]